MKVTGTPPTSFQAAYTHREHSRLSHRVKKVMLTVRRGARRAPGPRPRQWTAVNNAQGGNRRSRTVRTLAAWKPFQTA